MHKLAIGQAVRAVSCADANRLYYVVRKLKAPVGSEPHYRIKCGVRGSEHVVRETEIRPAFA